MARRVTSTSEIFVPLFSITSRATPSGRTALSFTPASCACCASQGGNACAAKISCRGEPCRWRIQGSSASFSRSCGLMLICAKRGGLLGTLPGAILRHGQKGLMKQLVCMEFPFKTGFCFFSLKFSSNILFRSVSTAHIGPGWWPASNSKSYSGRAARNKNSRAWKMRISKPL